MCACVCVWYAKRVHVRVFVCTFVNMWLSAAYLYTPVCILVSIHACLHAFCECMNILFSTCKCMFMYIYLYVCMHAHMCVCFNVIRHVCTFVYLYLSMHISLYMYARNCLYICIHLCLPVCMFACLSACLFATECIICVFVCMYQYNTYKNKNICYALNSVWHVRKPLLTRTSARLQGCRSVLWVASGPRHLKIHLGWKLSGDVGREHSAFLQFQQPSPKSFRQSLSFSPS